MKMFMTNRAMAAALLASVGLASLAQAQAVGGWALANGGGTLTNLSAGNYNYSNATGAGVQYATIGGSGGYSLGVGDTLSLTATVVTPLTYNAGDFEFGMMNTAGNSGFQGWTGDIVFLGTGTVQKASFRKDTGNTGYAWSSTGGTALKYAGATGTGASGLATAPSGTYSVSLTYTRTTSTALKLDYQMLLTKDGSGSSVPNTYWSYGASVTDSAPSTFAFNRAVFVSNGSAFTGTINFQNVTVTSSAVPEPASMLGLITLCSGVVLRRRRRS